MFPPRQAQSAQDLLQDLMASLGRAGLDVLPNVVQDGSDFHFKCLNASTVAQRKSLKLYVETYAKEAGWSARVRFQRPWRAFTISLEKSSSSFSKSFLDIKSGSPTTANPEARSHQEASSSVYAARNREGPASK